MVARLPVVSWPVRLARLALALMAVLAAPALGGQAPAAVPGSELEVYLVTMGPGDMIWERFGHNAILLHDPASGRGISYNFGYFDFAQKDFLLRFLRGKMLYQAVALDGEHVDIEDVRLDARGGRATARGTITLGAPLRFDAALAFSRFDPARFGDFPAGRINGDARGRGELGATRRIEANWRITAAVVFESSHISPEYTFRMLFTMRSAEVCLSTIPEQPSFIA